MKQKETIRSLWTPTAGMLSGARRAAMLLLTTLLLTMTAQTALAETVSYLNASGASQSHVATPVAGSSLGTNGSETWYVVNSDVELTSALYIEGNVHLILADNTTLSVTSNDYAIYMYENSSLTIYSQSLGQNMGKLVINSNWPIRIGANSLTINGGDISVTTNDSGVYLAANGSMTINNGTVSLTGSVYGVYVYNDEGSLTITGGTVTITAQTPIYNVNNYTKTGGTVTLNSTSGGGTVNVISYLDASGNSQSVDATPVTGSSLGTNGSVTWYVVNSDVELTSGLSISGTVHLILADNTTLSVTSSNYAIYMNDNSSLTIYSQSLGSDMGKLVINSKYYIHIDANSLTINGGDISVTTNNDAVYLAAGGRMTINNGTVSLTGKDYGVSNEYGSLTINGGTVTITGHTPIMNATNYTKTGGTVTLKDKSGNAYYKVLFDANGGSDVSAALVVSGGTVSKPEDPTRDGYVFVGWYNGANEYDFTAAVTTDLTLTAKWGKNIANCTATVPNQTMERFGGGDPYSYIYFKFEDAEKNPTSNVIGEVVKDGETTLTLGTDYEFGQITFAEPSTHDEKDNPCKPGDKCRVEIIGLGTYVGTAYADFTIISPSANSTYGDLSWSVADGTLSITGTGAMTAAATTAYPWYQYCSIITSVTIGDGVTSIADNAFGSVPNMYTYNNVAKVTIPASVTSIGADAFKGCITATDVYCYADPTKLTWGDTGDDFKSGKETKCHVADADAWSSFSSVNVAFVGDLAEKSIPYIDADGNMAYCTDFTVIDGNNGNAGWYVVKGNVSKDEGGIDFNGEAHIILADGASLTLSNGSLCGLSHLTIYGQAAGTGTLTATNDRNGIYTQNSGNLTINGGIINATAFGAICVGGNLVINGGTVTGTSTDGVDGLYAVGTITINGGQVTANGRIYSKGDLAINGGQVTATGLIATNDGNITLGWTNSSDQIKASQILTGQNTNTVSISNGKAFTDGTKAYTSATPSADLKTALNRNVTLRPVTGVTLTDDGSGLTAEFDGTSLTTLSIPGNVTVNAINFGREFTEGVPVTLMLPFSLADGQTFTGGTLYKFSGISKNETTGIWEATMTESATLHANTPYLMMPNSSLSSSGKVTIGLNSAPVTLNTTTAGKSSVTTDASDWEFKGSYEERHWYDGNDGVHAASNADEIGKVYGFAATSGKATDGVTDIAAGQFVRFASGAWIRPTRCYLIYNGTGTPGAGARNKRAAAGGELPDKITVRLIGLNGTTTAIGTLDTKTGELRFGDSWFSLDGTKLDGKPTKSGVYINNGKKIVVK